MAQQFFVSAQEYAEMEKSITSLRGDAKLALRDFQYKTQLEDYAERLGVPLYWFFVGTLKC